MDVTPRQILGMSAEQIAQAIAAFHQAGHHEKTNERYVYLSLADSMAHILRLTVSSDEANRLMVEQMELLKGGIEQLSKPVGEEVDAWLRQRTR